MSNSNVQKGKHGEAVAKEYLVRNGLYIIETRYRSPYGEVDIIARDGNTLCFVEVKARTSQTAGNPYDAVTAYKQERIKNTAQHYIDATPIPGIQEIRFDVISILHEPNHEKPAIRWFKNAFHD
ncbi:MAG: YraN family protein [Candidatus Omnitrophica bacterium]|nr:YraN family protein [Candidatus Omnitrophota bacterium]